MEESSKKEFRKIILKLYKSSEKQIQEWKEFKDYVTKEIETLKQNQTELLQMNSLTQIKITTQ